MDAAIKITIGGKDIRQKLGSMPTDIYAVDSEVNRRITYIEKDGEFAVCYGRQTMRFCKDVWQELVQVLNERNLTKYGIRPEV